MIWEGTHQLVENTIMHYPYQSKAMPENVRNYMKTSEKELC